MFSRSLTAALLAVTASAASYKKVEDAEADYAQFKGVMAANYPGYNYEFYEVTSDDGYVTTLMHLTNYTGANESYEEGFTPSRGPVLVANGALSNVLSWLLMPPTMPAADLAAMKEGMFVMDNGDGKQDAQLSWLEKKDEKLYKKLVTDAELAHDKENKIDKEADRCLQKRLDETYDVYTAIKEVEEGGNYTGEDSLPISLFNYGFDVWLAGNRGTIYNQGTVDADGNASDTFSSNPDEYWNWTVNELGQKDTMAQVDAINAVTGEKVSYVGYSMGTLSMMQALALGENADSVAKLNRVNLVTPCAINMPPADVAQEDLRQHYLDEYQLFTDNGFTNYMFGSHYVKNEYDTDADGNQYLVRGNEQEYDNISCGAGNVPFCTFINLYVDYSGEQSVKLLRNSQISSVTGETYANWDFDAWRADGTVGDKLDYGKINGVDVYLHVAGDDEVCHGLEHTRKIQSIVKEYSYDCASHMDPGSQDTATQQEFIKNIVIALNATTLAFSAAVATTALALF